MKAKIESTKVLVFLDKAMTVQARVWEGVSESGVPFTAYIAEVQVHRDADNSEFEAELNEHKFPDADTCRAVDARMIL